MPVGEPMVGVGKLLVGRSLWIDSMTSFQIWAAGLPEKFIYSGIS